MHTIRHILQLYFMQCVVTNLISNVLHSWHEEENVYANIQKCIRIVFKKLLFFLASETVYTLGCSQIISLYKWLFCSQFLVKKPCNDQHWDKILAAKC